jgi:hypothetical protein
LRGEKGKRCQGTEVKGPKKKKGRIRIEEKEWKMTGGFQGKIKEDKALREKGR